MEEKRNRTIFLCLLALSHGPKHGYEISKYIEAKSAGFFRVPFGSLYPVLHRLELELSIQAKWDDSTKPKKIYTLTAKGKKALRDELAAFDSLTGAIMKLAEV
jgi:PadR family transcriptional regulator, regulatory protein PadR